MKKLKIVLFCLLLNFIFPFSSTLAAKTGSINEAAMTSYSMQNPEYATDGDESTQAIFGVRGANLVYEFPKAVNITKYYLRGNFTSNQAIMTFFEDETGNIIYSGWYLEQGYVDINIRAVKKIILESDSLVSNRLWINEFNVWTDEDKEPPGEINNLKTKITEKNVELFFDNPTDTDFKSVHVYLDGKLIGNTENGKFSFNVGEYDRNYVVNLKTVDIFGNESIGTVKDIYIPDPTKDIDVQSLEALPTHDSVFLKWQIPNSFFNHATIYRKNVAATRSTRLARSIDIEYSPLFETNGTNFKDLSVSPSTEYQYKVTSVNASGYESPGVEVKVKTLAEPKPTVPPIEGGDFEENENGDFLFTWTSPTTGKVKVLIDGREYSIVEASLQQILIPKENMKYDIFNNPKVTLVPISEDGTEGTPSKPGEGGGSGGVGGGKIPFGPADLLKSIMGLLGVIAPILLLSLAFIFFKPIKNVIVKAVKTNRERKMYR